MEEIKLTDTLDELLKIEHLKAFLTDAATFDSGNKTGCLGAYLALCLRDEQTKQYLVDSINTNGWTDE